ncbi:MAG TPA: zf-HC2 domain-containing protein [Vicinamibacterales bacterium]|jgi:hypothetical protein|nr:zf-HC2 domain-containing protein [Vicinamibacterales bacterium]
MSLVIHTTCDQVHDQIADFVDGELRGPDVLRMLEHLDTCTACAEEVKTVRQMGDALRTVAASEPLPRGVDGLSSAVISRARAEADQSWLAFVARACEDWHWAYVGAGAVAATFVSTLLLSVILAFGPAPARDDSLSALITNLGSSAGWLFLYGTPVGGYDAAASTAESPVLLQVDNGGPAASGVMRALAERTSDGAPSEADLVGALAAEIRREGQAGSFQSMRPADRQRVEALLEQITRFRLNDVGGVGTTMLNVHEVRLVTSTSVSAKGL